MAKNDETVESTEDCEIVIARLLKAPRELVFNVWTGPEHLVQW